MARGLARTRRIPKPLYDPESGENYVIQECFYEEFLDQYSQCRSSSSLRRDETCTQAWSLVCQLSNPRIVFTSWGNCTLYLAGCQIIDRRYRPVFYADLDYVEQWAEDEEQEEGQLTYKHAQWMPYFNRDYIPPGFQRFVPPFDPGAFTRARSNPSGREDAPWRDNPDFEYKRLEPTRGDVPLDAYYIEEAIQFFDDGMKFTVLFPMYNSASGCEYLGMFTDGGCTDRDSLWDEAYQFVASHQLFWRNIRPVWVSPMIFEHVQYNHEDSADAEERRRFAYDFPNDPDWGMEAVGNVDPYWFEGFHLEHYPYAIGSALGLPSPPTPGNVPPPAIPTAVANRQSLPRPAFRRTFLPEYDSLPEGEAGVVALLEDE